MKCLRCGYCCLNYDVMIVDDPAKGIRRANVKHKRSGERCQHLEGDAAGKFSCAIHGKSWYCKTPCSAHGQIERKNAPCRIGEYVLRKGDKKP